MPRPSISGISPKSATAGGNSFLLSVDGSDFRRDSAVSWNGSFRATSFVSSDRLVAAITTADIANPGMVLVFVFNPPENNTTRVSGAIGVNTVTVCSGKDSNAVPFTVNPWSAHSPATVLPFKGRVTVDAFEFQEVKIQSG